VITPGSILIKKGTPLPDGLKLGSDCSQAAGWASVANGLDSHEVERKLTTGGWTFIYTAGLLRTNAFGFDRAKMIHAALRRLLASVKQHKCNCLEIDDVSTHSFLGMQSISVSGHSRNIQKGVLFISNA
jgi:hypothetical protein